MKKLPSARPERIEAIAIALYGPIGWRRRLAEGLGMARVTLWEYMRGKRGRDIDADLLALIERERAATVTRRVRLRLLRDELAGLRKREARKAVRHAA